MKKSIFGALTLALAAVLPMSAMAQQSGSIDASYGHAAVSNNYGDANIFSVNGRYALNKNTAFTGNLVDISAWHQHGTGASAGLVQTINDSMYGTLNVFVSDQTLILPKYRLTGQLNFKVGTGFILGVGADHIVMRGGPNKDDALLLSAVYYVPGMPLVIQTDARLDNATPGNHRGERYGVAVTYGKVGEWTLSGRADSGVSGYESSIVPGQLVRFPVKHESASLSKWLGGNYGVTVAADNVANKYYNRRELRVGAFYTF